MQPGTNAAPRGDTADTLHGRLLDGRYRVGARIARGGMASVYQATDLRLDRTVAVKVMHPGLADDEEFAARFVREARAAARLAHPNVVGVYDQGEQDGVVFLVMEHVPGRTLRDVVRAEAPLPPARALALLEPVLAALAAAHRAGLVHRDVKPENVLIGADPAGPADQRRAAWDSGGHAGRVKVADFGLAKAVSADTQHTATGGILIGTVSYLAPEVVVDGRADPRADVYAAGVVLYELLTGRKPHEGDSPIQVAYKHVHEDVPAPSARVPAIPAYVDALVARATARDPRHRPADAGVLLHQLRRVGQALADGVAEDPELTADLTPLLTHPDTGEPAVTAGVVESTADIVADVARWLAPESPSSSPALTAAPPASVAGRLARLEDPVVEGAEERPGSVRILAPDQSAVRAGRSPGGPGPRGRSRWRGPLLFLLTLALAAGGGYAAWWFGVARYTVSPGVLGLSEVAAERRLEAEGLRVDWGEAAYSETVPAGRVLATDPEPGSRVLDGGTVTVVLSRGKERYDVPRLRGLTEDRAQDALLAGGLEFGRSREAYSERIREGRVIASSPTAGTTLRPDTAVNLVVSLGRRPIAFGDWTGRDADRAEESLAGRGLKVTRTESYSGTVAAGRVVSQSPATGPLFRGQTVRLEVSKGPQLVAVPTDLVASGVDAARASVEARGLAVEVRNAESYLGLGYVFSVDPGEGALVPVGSTVVLYLI